jgi:hypothetical protein
VLSQFSNSATGLSTEESGLDSRQGQETSSIQLRPAVGPTQPPIQWVPGPVSLTLKRQGCEARHSPPSSAEVKNDGPILPLPNMSLIKPRDNFTFNYS